MSSYAPQLASCGTCGVPLADDQRYCLNCGSRTAEPHVPPPGAVSAPLLPPPGEGIPVGVVAERDPTPLLALGVLAALVLVLVVGVLLGRSGNSGSTQAAAPQIVRVGGTGAGASSGGGSASNASNAGGGGAVKSEWPKGKDGFTVELGSVKKNGASAAAVASAKSDAKGKSAPDVGVLDSNLYGSLPGGDYVVYSGVFDSKKKAMTALEKLRGRFPDATVVKVSAGGGGGGGNAAAASTAPPGSKAVSGAAAKKAVQDLNQSGAAYEKNLKKKPKTIALPGKPPPPDHKAAGGGSKAQTFG